MLPASMEHLPFDMTRSRQQNRTSPGTLATSLLWQAKNRLVDLALRTLLTFQWWSELTCLLTYLQQQ